MKPFDTVALFAHLESLEAELLAGSVVVTAAPDQFLADLIEALVRPN